MNRHYEEQRASSSRQYFPPPGGSSNKIEASYNNVDHSSSGLDPFFAEGYNGNVANIEDSSYIDDHGPSSNDASTKTIDGNSGMVYGIPQPRNEQKPSSLVEYKNKCRDFWPTQKRKIEMMNDNELRSMARHMELPMARVKKIMKIDDDVRAQMISQDAPLILSAACEFFIQELTLKGWQSVEEGRRKTLQKCDVSSAVSHNEHFDFLIDIVPRDENKKFNVSNNTTTGVSNEAGASENLAQSYVVGDLDPSGQFLNLSNGQVIHATVIGQPIPLDGENALDINQLPPGVQVIDVNQTVGSSNNS